MRKLVAVAAAVISAAGFCAAGQPPVQNEVRAAITERIRDLNLTQAQEAAIAGIREEYAPRVDEAVWQLRTVVKEEIDAARAVLTPEQKAKLDVMKEERKEWRTQGVADRIAHLKDLDLTDDEITKLADIRKEYRPKIIKSLESLKGILTPEQARLREDLLKAGKPRAEVITALKLTDDQKAKVEVVGAEVRTLLREQIEKMRAVLTPEQQDKIAAMKDERRERVRDRMVLAILHFDDLNLTEQQKAKIQSIRAEYRPRVEQAGDNLRAIVREELSAIVTELRA
ncbi:MAG: hypothetical protein IT436_08890 [Phycisphaerales bacterium]|nr:hypothetical protein [Phycisphaerales bacterium]